MNTWVLLKYLFIPVLFAIALPHGSQAQVVLMPLDTLPGNNNTILPHSGGCLFAGTGYGMYKSCTGGVTWDKIVDSLYVWRIVEDRNGVILAGTSKWLLRSTDEGSTWDTLYTTAKPYRYINIHIDEHNNYLVSILELGIQRSTDEGKTWSSIQAQLADERVDYEMLGSDDAGNIYAALSVYGGVYRSTDNGQHWTQILSEALYQSFTDIQSVNENILILSYSEVHRSTNYGVDWNTIDIDPNTSMDDGYRLCTDRYKSLYAVRNSGIPGINPIAAKIFRSTDGGSTWAGISAPIYISAGIEDVQISSSGYMYIVSNDSIYRTTTPVVTSTPALSQPEGFTLLPAYPNPVVSGNDATLSYTLPSTGNVSLTLYNALGKVAYSAETYREYGSHNAHIPTSGLPPGVFWYTLRAGQNTATRLLVIR